MAFSKSTRQARQSQTKVQSPPGKVVSPQLTHEEVMDMLKDARADVDRDYAHLPRLQHELQAQYHEGEEACELRELGPVEILFQRLRGEHTVFNAFNKHRLGQAKWKCYKGHEVPEDAAELLQKLGDDIDEDLELFPLRYQVVTYGFPSLTEDLPPIYQTSDHAAQFSRDHDRLPMANVTPSTKGKTRRHVENYDKLLGAPVPNLDFPTGNITLPELAAFHPEGIKSWDMIDRLCGNGGSQASYAAMVNFFRVMSRGRIPNNTVCRYMKASMEKRALTDSKYNGWKSRDHLQLGNPTGFDPASVSVTGFHNPGNGKVTTSAPPIPIKDMAKDVQTFPSGNDALDLTRAVQYCVSHPDEVWMYPTDYARLVNQLGAAPVQPGHQDSAAIARYAPARIVTGSQTTSRRKRPENRRARKADSDEEEGLAMDTGSEDSDSDLDVDSLDNKGKKRKNTFDGSDNDDFDDALSRKPAQKRAKTAPKPRAPRKRAPAPSHLRKEVELENIDSESDGEAYQGPKKMKKATEVRRSGRATKVTQSYVIHPDDVRDGEEDQVSSLLASSLSSSSLSDHDPDMGDPEE